MASGDRGHPRDMDEPGRLDLYLSKDAIEAIRAQGKGNMSSFVECLLKSDELVRKYGIRDLPRLAKHDPRLIAEVLLLAKMDAETDPEDRESRIREDGTS